MIRETTVYVAHCDGCGRILGQDRGEIFLIAASIVQAHSDVAVAGWTVHPDGTIYCKEVRHP